MAEAWALRRADLRPDMVKYAIGAGFGVDSRNVNFAEIGRQREVADVQSLRLKLMVI